MGIAIGLIIILLWLAHLAYLLTGVTVNFASPLMYLHMLIQAYLYTGLFITAHDAMHRTVAKKAWINKVFGYATLLLYAGMWYPSLTKYHWKHHAHPGTGEDPDYHVGSQNFFIWYFSFMKHYITLWQLIYMAVLFNILRIWFDVIPLIMFWIVPAFLSTFQLFYFGTYLPHRQPHTPEMEPHKARSQKRNHVWAMLSCYFFGYHYEHHERPNVPWWKLYKVAGGSKQRPERGEGSQVVSRWS